MAKKKFLVSYTFGATIMVERIMVPVLTPAFGFRQVDHVDVR